MIEVIATDIRVDRQSNSPVVRLRPSCDGDPTNPPNVLDTAAPAVRLAWFTEQFANHANISICSAFGERMDDIAGLALSAMGR